MTIAQTYTRLTANQADFQPRPSQLAMVKLIDHCFDNVNPELKDGHNICLIEAPTGTGKSLAYIVAGVTNAKKNGKKFVISTATKTLQGQLFNKDLPQFIQDGGEVFSYGLAKGRSNYLCPYQLELSLSGSGGDMLAVADKTQEKLQQIATEYASKHWDGDLDNAPLFIESKLKPLITIDKHQCIGYQCPYNQKDNSSCPFYKNRELLKSCEVIVTNHSLLLADLDHGGGIVLPVKPADYYLCIDEAHNFPSYAINGFMGQFELKQSLSLVNNAAKLIVNPHNNSYICNDISLCDDLVTKLQDLGDALEKLYQILRLNQNLFSEDQGKLVLILNDYLNPAITQDLKDLFMVLAFSSVQVVDSFLKVQEQLKDKLKNSHDYVAEANLVKLGFYLATLEGIAATANYLINQDNSRFNANARWVESRISGEDFNIIAGVTNVGKVLAAKLCSQIYAVCLTSATLAIGPRFDYVKFQLGLNFLPAVQESKLETTFNYPEHSQLVIPQFMNAPEYSKRTEFQRELSLYLSQILNYTQAYGTLVLFFNRQQLLETFKQLPLKLQNKILLQTEFSSNQKLIAEHKDTVDKQQPSIIFGLNSFAEGVDLPAKYCMHVLITKLPFETHKDPQNMVREYWVKAENGNYFMDVSLPETCIKLIQAVGRLIRSEKDYGQVTICDNRIVLKQYGSILLDSLPDFNRDYNPEFINQVYLKLN